MSSTLNFSIQQPVKSVDPQGRNATRSGKKAENLIERKFVQYGIPVITFKEWRSANFNPTISLVAVKQFQHGGRYKFSKSRCDFVLCIGTRVGWVYVGIESAHQDRPGSVMQKIDHRYNDLQMSESINVGYLVYTGKITETDSFKSKWEIHKAESVKNPENKVYFETSIDTLFKNLKILIKVMKK